MDLSLEYHRPVLEAAARGDLVLTVNNRLSRHLHVLFDACMQQQGRAAWKTPEICSIDGWMRRSLTLLGEEGRLLGDFSALRLWEEAIESETPAGAQTLLQTAATARRALQAHRLLTEHDADAELAGVPLTEDHLAFIRWRRRFRESLSAGDWLDAADLSDRIGTALRRKQIPAPSRVLLVGFDEVPPQIRRIAAALTDAGAAVEEVFPDETCGVLVRIPAADIADEVRRAARWVRHLLDNGQERIGIVVPGLQDYRTHIERIFSEEIDPEVLPGLAEEEDRFSLSLGSPLAAHGLVAAALEVLALQLRSPVETIGFLLRSPYLGGGLAESHGRAALDRDLRSRRSMEIGLSRLGNLAAGKGGSGGERRELPQLAGICEAVTESLAAGGKRSPGEWIVHFSRLLEQVGWPGERPLSSFEYQVHKAWREKVLPTMAALDAVSPPLERGAALSLLRRLAQETDFQPETPEGPVRVIGLLESAGLHFDHLWIMGLIDEVLPAPPRPNPFIPISLQVAQGMPHADAGRELDFARRTVRRLFGAAPKVILSHPCRNGDVELRPSPLIVQVAHGRVDMAPTNSPAAIIHALSPPFERVVDERAPVVPAGENTLGGTGILKDQALCPFRAFAHHRLHARAFDRPDVGLDAGARGTLLHGALEEFWRITESWEKLCALDEQTLEARIASCIDASIDRQFSEGRRDAATALLALERRRLSVLVREWLEVDRKRPPFKVWKPEAKRRKSIGGLTIDIRVDRIDALDDGRRVILDYKTGQVDLADLFGERLVEPQLPLYGIGEGEETLAGIAFARVRPGDCGLKGIAAGADLLPGVEAVADSRVAGASDISGWAELLERWRRQLEELCAEFVGGKASVVPADPKKSCRYCDVFPLCRIDEIARLVEDPA